MCIRQTFIMSSSCENTYLFHPEATSEKLRDVMIMNLLGGTGNYLETFLLQSELWYLHE